MSFAKRLLSSIGIGAATVDTKLEKSEFVPGEELRGVVEVKGGSTPQEVDGIFIEIQTTYKRETNDKEVTETGTIERIPVASGMTVNENFQREIPFSCRLPYETPITVGRSEIWVRTALDVRSALDPSDRDSILVKPNALMQTVLDAITRLGFQQRNVENEELPHHMRRRLKFGQEFEFRAEQGEFRGKLDELELVMFPSEGRIDLMLQVDRRVRGLGSLLSEAAGMDESRVSLTVTDSEGVDEVAAKISGEIRNHA